MDSIPDQGARVLYVSWMGNQKMEQKQFGSKFNKDFRNGLYLSISIYVCVCEVVQSCLTLCDPVDRSPPGSSVPGILQARILEWVATPFPRGPTPPRDQARASHLGRWIAYRGAAQEALPV